MRWPGTSTACSTTGNRCPACSTSFTARPNGWRVSPPDEAILVHQELAEALAEARELTAELAEALGHGGLEAASPHVWEWRGALFRIRFARVRLERPSPAAVATLAPAPPVDRPPVLAAIAVAVGSSLVLVAALLGLWLLVAIMLTGTVAGSVLLRP